MHTFICQHDISVIGLYQIYCLEHHMSIGYYMLHPPSKKHCYLGGLWTTLTKALKSLSMGYLDNNFKSSLIFWQ